MARPTDEKKEKTVKLRISEDLYNKLVSKGANLSETIRKILFESFVPQNKAEISEKIEASPNRDMEEIESMANFFGVSGESLLKMVCDGLMDGTLTVENGKILGTPDLYLDNFKDACHEVGADPQKILDKATQGVKRGQL